MKNELIKAFVNLLKVKSIMTIVIMIVFVVLALKMQLNESLTASVITAVITYYFAKNEKGNDKNE